MSLYAYVRPRAKSKPAPVRHTVVLFDATRFQPLPFAGRPAPKPTLDLSASEMRRIDAARHAAYADALDMLGHDAATEYAGEVAERAVVNLRMARQTRERRMPYTAADLAWLFQQDTERDWDTLANERACEEQLCAGVFCG